jgi:hypothetical protein
LAGWIWTKEVFEGGEYFKRNGRAMGRRARTRMGCIELRDRTRLGMRLAAVIGACCILSAHTIQATATALLPSESATLQHSITNTGQHFTTFDRRGCVVRRLGTYLGYRTSLASTSHLHCSIAGSHSHITHPLQPK